MTLAELLCSLRERLWRAWETNNQEDLSLLMTVFGVMREELYASKNEPLIVLVADMEESTRRAMMGFKSIKEIPTIERIQAVFGATPASKKA